MDFSVLFLLFPWCSIWGFFIIFGVNSDLSILLILSLWFISVWQLRSESQPAMQYTLFSEYAGTYQTTGPVNFSKHKYLGFVLFNSGNITYSVYFFLCYINAIFLHSVGIMIKYILFLKLQLYWDLFDPNSRCFFKFIRVIHLGYTLRLANHNAFCIIKAIVFLGGFFFYFSTQKKNSMHEVVAHKLLPTVHSVPNGHGLPNLQYLVKKNSKMQVKLKTRTKLIKQRKLAEFELGADYNLSSHHAT